MELGHAVSSFFCRGVIRATSRAIKYHEPADVENIFNTLTRARSSVRHQPRAGRCKGVERLTSFVKDEPSLCHEHSIDDDHHAQTHIPLQVRQPRARAAALSELALDGVRDVEQPRR